MAEDPNRVARTIFAAMGLSLLVFAVWVYRTQTFGVHGRFLHPYAQSIDGSAAVRWALLLASFGVGLMGPVLFRRPSLIGGWMTAWFVCGIGAMLVSSYR